MRSSPHWVTGHHISPHRFDERWAAQAQSARRMQIKEIGKQTAWGLASSMLTFRFKIQVLIRLAKTICLRCTMFMIDIVSYCKPKYRYIIIHKICQHKSWLVGGWATHLNKYACQLVFYIQLAFPQVYLSNYKKKKICRKPPLTPPKTNMEPKNDDFQVRNLPFPGIHSNILVGL